MNAHKSMIIAPAGYGKTHTIVEAVKNHELSKKVLILTHTHAGVASLRKKLKIKEVPHSKYSLETISSFTLHFVNSYYLKKNELSPELKGYFDLAVDIMYSLLKAQPIKEIIKAKYSQLIVDEYQDCSTKHHNLIVELSSLIKTHILGDPMQGIFNFNGDSLVDLKSKEQMSGFIDNKQTLETPWRWEGNNNLLGRALKQIREEYLEKYLPIDLTVYKKYDALCYWQCKLNPKTGDGFYDPNIQKGFTTLFEETTGSLLILVPEKHMVNLVSKSFTSKYRIHPFEAFDDKFYYEKAKIIDKTTDESILSDSVNLLRIFFQANPINIWFKKDVPIKKTLDKLNNKQKVFYERLTKLISHKVPDRKWLLEFLNLFKREYYFNCTKLERFNAIISAINYAISENTTVYDGMVRNRDIARRLGRKTDGKYIGTTYLTKGLEFDTVVVLNAHLFKDPKNLYVALTRATKKLIVVSDNIVLNPYKN